MNKKLGGIAVRIIFFRNGLMQILDVNICFLWHKIHNTPWKYLISINNFHYILGNFTFFLWVMVMQISNSNAKSVAIECIRILKFLISKLIFFIFLFSVFSSWIMCFTGLFDKILLKYIVCPELTGRCQF